MNLPTLIAKASNAWTSLWSALPIQARSAINVVAGAAETALVGYLLTNYAHLSFTGAGGAVWAAVGTAVGTILTRTVNPADQYPAPKPATTTTTGSPA